MKRIALLVCGLLVMGMLSGCGQSAPEEKLLTYWENIVQMLRDNRTEPAAAARVVKEYLSANIVEIKDLTGKIGNQESGAVVRSAQFIERESKIRAAILDLEKNTPALLDDSAVKSALEPLDGIGL